MSEDGQAPLSGGCYCGAVRYEARGDAMMRAQCHCRECQYMTGGGPNYFMLLRREGFSYVKGAPKTFARADLETPVTREFCADCGAHLTTQLPGRPLTVVKVGTLDDPSGFRPDMAIYTIDMQPFHQIPEGLPSFERMPG